MGGRGASSGADTLATQKSSNDIATYMKAKHGVTIDSSLVWAATTEQIRTISGELEGLLNEFPQLRNIQDPGGKTRDAIVSVGASKLGANTGAHATFGGKIEFNTLYMGKGTRGTTNHEAGHLMERALILKNEKTYIDRAMAWNKCTQAKRVIGEACKTLKKSGLYGNMKNDDFVAQVSRYATTNRSEALAECVRDYRHHGEKASPLSVEVWKILKRELG